MPPRKEIPDWNTPGMDLFEQAMHLIDLEAEDLGDDPEQIMLGIAKAEHCYYVLFMSLRNHLPPKQKKVVRPPKRRFPRAVADNLRDTK